jgi:hypothetical protein
VLKLNRWGVFHIHVDDFWIEACERFSNELHGRGFAGVFHFAGWLVLAIIHDASV